MKKSSHPISSASFLARLKSRALDAVLFSLFSIFFIGGIVYALTYPSAPPAGETAGGKFATIFNRILQSGNYATDTTGKVKLATNADTAPWSGITAKPFNWAGQGGQPSWLWGSNDGSNYYVWNPSNFNVANATTTSQIGTLTAGKWCTSNGSTLSCTSDAPTTTPVAPPGTSVYGGIAWQTTNTGPVTYPAAATYCNNLAPAGTWRIPTLSEMDYARTLGMTFTANRFIWSSTPFAGTPTVGASYNAYSPSYGWFNGFAQDGMYCYLCDGGIYHAPPAYVRCVKNL